MPFYVIDGGPCTGKTTLVNALEQEGYLMVPEAARLVIQEQQAINGQDLPWINRESFQMKVLARQIDLESKINPESKVFIDRGIPSGIAYFILDDLSAPNELMQLARIKRYERVFILEPLECFVNDETRAENVETGLKIHRLIKQVYKDLDYEIIEVPEMSVKKRINYILNEL